MQQAIIWTNADPTHWHIYAALGRDELSHLQEQNKQQSQMFFFHAFLAIKYLRQT